jgi:predicted DNA-binding transcriptional regulator AlpA
MAVTNDEYEIPIAIGETREELAELLGIKPTALYKALHRKGTNSKKTMKYIKVEFEEEQKKEIKPQNSGKSWTSKEEDYLKDKYGNENLEYIARKLKRSVKGVKEKIKYLELGKAADATEYITAAELSKCLGRSKSTVQRWIKNKGLKAEVKNITINKNIYRIDIDDFWKWCKDNLKLMEWDLYQRNGLTNEPIWLDAEIKKYYKNKVRNSRQDWSKTQKELLRHYYNQGLKVKEIANLLGRTEKSIYSMVNEVQAKKKKINIPWKPIEIETLLNMREKKISYESIAEELGREVACVTVKYYSLKKEMQA